MASIDKAAIVFSMAIVAIGVGIAFSLGVAQDAGPIASAPVVSKTVEPKTQAQPIADIANKVKEEAQKEPLKSGSVSATTTPSQSVEVKEKVNMEETPKKETMMKEPTGPTTHTVEIPIGSSSPGCEESNECFSPASITINVGDTVEWTNTDTAAHTVTAGSPADGPSGTFDSSLVMADASYAFTFEEAGTFNYFCMVHPWMTGSVTVN